MPDQFTEARYKDRIIIIGVKWSKNFGPYESHFTIWGKQSGRWEINYQGSEKQLFEKKDDGFFAGDRAARAWIDAQEASQE